jgi:hypothetical protein
MTQGVLKTHGICLMMYFKNNWNAGPFFLLHGYFRRKKTYIYMGVDVVEWSRALDVRLSEWCCSVTMVWVQIPSREEQQFDSSKI